jgi:hypothetical protein
LTPSKPDYKASDATKSYTAEFKAQLVALLRAGRTPESLAYEYEPSAPNVRDQAAEATESPVVDRDARNVSTGLRHSGCQGSPQLIHPESGQTEPLLARPS